LQQLAQPGEPGEGAALDRPERLPELLRNLRLRQAAVVRELDRLALVRGQLLERVLNDAAMEADRGPLVARLPGRELLRLQRLRAAALLAAHEVDRAPVDERQDPGARAGALREEPGRRAPDGQEGVLDGVLGERVVAEDAQREPVGDAAETVVELG